MTEELRVTKRGNDWHAQVGDDGTIWDCGATPYEAIGRLIVLLDTFRDKHYKVVIKR